MNNQNNQNNYQQPMYGQQPVQPQYNQFQQPVQPQYNQFQQPNYQPQYNQGYNMQQTPKKTSNTTIILIILLAIGLFVGAVVLSINADDSEENSSSNSNNSNQIVVKKGIANTAWLNSKDNTSEIVFQDDTAYWYKDKSDHSDNYHVGKFKYYRGEEAISYMSTDLTKYGVTRDEINGLIDRNEKYKKDDFVVIDFTFNESNVNGEKKTIDPQQMVWFGFVLNNDTELDLVNADTASYIYFKKE